MMLRYCEVHSVYDSLMKLPPDGLCLPEILLGMIAWKALM